RCRARTVGRSAGPGTAPAGTLGPLDGPRLLGTARRAPAAPARQRRADAVRVPAGTATRDRGAAGHARGPLHAARVARQPARCAAGARPRARRAGAGHRPPAGRGGRARGGGVVRVVAPSPGCDPPVPTVEPDLRGATP